MRALTFWKTVVMDKANFLESLIALLREHGIPFCVIGGHAVNARYADFVERASEREVLGVIFPVASLEDTLRGKVWEAQDLSQRPSERQKDLADIARLLEAYPELRDQVPKEILERLL